MGMKAASTHILDRPRFTFMRAALLVVSIVGVFSVLSIWAPVRILLIALVLIAFAGGAGLGKGAAVLVSLTVMAIVGRAELIAAHPVDLRIFLVGGIGIAIVPGGVALVGAQRVAWYADDLLASSPVDKKKRLQRRMIRRWIRSGNAARSEGVRLTV